MPLALMTPRGIQTRQCTGTRGSDTSFKSRGSQSRLPRLPILGTGSVTVRSQSRPPRASIHIGRGSEGLFTVTAAPGTHSGTGLGWFVHSHGCPGHLFWDGALTLRLQSRLPRVSTLGGALSFTVTAPSRIHTSQRAPAQFAARCGPALACTSSCGPRRRRRCWPR